MESLENRDKVWKKWLKVFWKLYVKCFTSEIFFLLVKIYSISPVHLQCIVGKALFLLFKRSILLTSLINLSLEKEITVFEEVWKNLEFWIQKSLQTRQKEIELQSNVINYLTLTPVTYQA